MRRVNLKEMDTYIFIDSSNIKNALKVSQIKLDFHKLYVYFQSSYKNLKFIKYFEGIDKEDSQKYQEFMQLEKLGYDLCVLERKSYTNSPKYKVFKCVNCSHKNTVKILDEKKTFKSNIDVYLCSELMRKLLHIKKASHVIILSCDGDYAEMIKILLHSNPNIHISVFATPFTRNNNYLSVRLKELERIDRYFLVNILSIKDRIKTDENKRELHRSGTLER